MINTNSLKHNLMAVKFAIWDLHLYSDTHPEDYEAKRLMREYKEKYAVLLPEYECKYGAVTSRHDENCTWTTVPFPWVMGSDC